MRIFLSIKYHADQSNRPLIETFCGLFEQHGCQVKCIARDVEVWGEKQFDAPELMRRTFETIKQSDLVVVELSEKGVGVGIEAGYACAIGIPILTVARRGSDISETLQGVSQQVLFYERISDLLDMVPQEIWRMKTSDSNLFS
jgi:hypothetical protein